MKSEIISETWEQTKRRSWHRSFPSIGFAADCEHQISLAYNDLAKRSGSRRLLKKSREDFSPQGDI